MLQVRTDRLIPLTKARQQIGRLIDLVQDDEFYVITSTGTPKVALVDVDYLGYLKQLEEKTKWQENFGKSLNHFSQKAQGFSSTEIKKDIAGAIKKLRREKTKSSS